VCLCKIYKPQQLVRPRHTKKMALINNRLTLPPPRKLTHDNRIYSVIISEVIPRYLNRGPEYCFLSEERKQLEQICIIFPLEFPSPPCTAHPHYRLVCCHAIDHVMNDEDIES
jgi:hypothetical protein